MFNKIALFNFLQVICLSVFFNSCALKTEPSPWNEEVVPVVFSIITPGEEVQVYVGTSYSEDTTTNHYTPTKVFISEKDSSWIELNAQDSAVYSTNDIRIKSGSTYLLKVETGTETVYAQTTVPTQDAEIVDGKCIRISNTTGDNVHVYTYNCMLKVQLRFSENKEYGYYLTAFSNVIASFLFSGSETFELTNFMVERNVNAFNIEMTTVDQNLRKFLRAVEIHSNTFDGDDIANIITLYGGNYPAYSNITNGVGLFGSFVKSSKLIYVTNN